jgi:flagellar M-ring protein FliF
MAVTHLVASAVEGLTPEAVSLVDMEGSLLSRPKRASATDGSEITSETLEVRAQLEHSLVAKINQTLEPLLGANGFRAGASVDIDLTSGEQQEETLDPSRSVMVNSQKTEDVTDRAATAGIPGTASNLPAPQPAPHSPGSAVSRRTENIQYQTSRIVRHTRTPQGVVRRMSLAVLVGQGVRWDGDGGAKHRVLVAPTPETLKTIKDLVAGITGFSAERGDQLIVESLPFESSLNSEPPSLAPVAVSIPIAKDPPWLEFANKHRNLLIPGAIGLVVLLVLSAVFKMMRRKKNSVDVLDELSSPSVHTQLSPAATAIVSAGELEAADERTLTEGSHDELAERVRQSARRDPAATANVLRMWLQDTRAEASKI